MANKKHVFQAMKTKGQNIKSEKCSRCGMVKVNQNNKTYYFKDGALDTRDNKTICI